MPGCAELIRAFFDETIADSPVLASQLGIDGFDDQLDDLSEAAIEDRRRRSAAWLQRLQAVADEQCATPDDRVDRDLVVSLLRGRAVLDDWLVWRRQPELYLNPGLTGVFSLFLHRLKPEPELARAAASRLRAVPGVLEAGRRNTRAELASSIYVDRAMRQARAGARYAREFVAGQVADPALRAPLAEAG